MLGTDGKTTSRLSKKQICKKARFVPQNFKKPPVKYCIRIPMFLIFVKLSTRFYARLFKETYFYP